MLSDLDLQYSQYTIVRNNLTNLTGNGVDPDLMEQMSRLIWIYANCPHNKGIYIWRKGLRPELTQI
jgi:hypothetical protein